MRNKTERVIKQFKQLSDVEKEYCIHRLMILHKNEQRLRNQKKAKRRWNEYEDALLVELFYRIEAGAISKTDGISALSQALRRMAVTHGIEIDATYRNENGVRMCLDQILYLVSDGEKGLQNSGKLLKDIVDLYSCDRAAFDQLLVAAKDLL